MSENQFKKAFIKARKAVIEGDFAGLNPMQREAVMKTEGPLLLLAGAGSGKTTVLINRVANLIKYGRGSDTDEVPLNINEEDVQLLEQYAKTRAPELSARARRLCAVEPAMPWTIIAITFTNKAANELKDRLEAMLGPDARDVWASTFHSACVRILRRDIDRLGFSKTFTIYDTSDSERVIKDVIKSLNLDDKVYPPRSVRARISSVKDSRVSPEEFTSEWEKRGDRRMSTIGRIYGEYQRRLREYGALDFDDIIAHTVTLLLEHKDVLEFYQKKFRYVLIDEYQDTNNLQYLFAKLLAGGHKNICVVGDDDQSIYRFRGATIENILNFENEYKGCSVIRLEQNYRSTEQILAAANSVISNNIGRKGKKLWTENPSGNLITVYTAMNENDEAQYVSTSILRGYAETRRWSDYAVLYRINAQSNRLEHAFKRNGIPYRVVGGTGFFERAEVKDMLSYLCVINNRADDVRLRRIINNPARGIGDRTLDTADAIAFERGVSVFSVISGAAEIPELSKSAAKLDSFVGLINALDAKKEEMSLVDFYDAVVSETGYLNMLISKNDVQSRTRVENIHELKSSIISYVEGAEEPSLAGFLDEVALYTDLDTLDRDADAVVMMTMHSAKGLEFPCVFIVGAEEGIFPGIRAIGEAEEMEEERRLCYVAVTRAKRELTITCARQRMLFGRTSSNKLSRFIEEISPELLDRSEAAPSYYFEDTSMPASRGYSYEKPAPPPNRSGSSGAASDSKKPYIPAQKPKGSELKLSRGDTIEHTAFGRGVVTGVQSMGGDALIEVAFDETGTKRLMLNTAEKHMKKV